MKLPQRPSQWPWVTLPNVAWVASIVLLFFEFDVFVLGLAGLFALLALRQFLARRAYGT